MIPSHAKKVFSGVIFDVYQWPQEMFDGSHETFEMLQRADTAEVIAVKDGKILLQEQEQPNKPIFYCLPGGRIEEKEEPLAGAKRELLEESGFVSEQWENFHCVKPFSKVEWNMYVYVARDCRLIQEQRLDAGEKINTHWITLDELIEMIDTGKVSRIEQEFMMQCIRAKYHQPSYIELKSRIFGP